MKKYLRRLGITFALLSFIWAYKTTNGNIPQSFELAAKALFFFVVVEIGLKLKAERKASGLTDDQFILIKAGGPDNLLQKANKIRKLAYGFIVAPFLSTVVFAVVFGSDMTLSSILSFCGLLCIIFFPFAALLFWITRRPIRVAKQANPLPLKKTG